MVRVEKTLLVSELKATKQVNIEVKTKDSVNYYKSISYNPEDFDDKEKTPHQLVFKRSRITNQYKTFNLNEVQGDTIRYYYDSLITDGVLLKTYKAILPKNLKYTQHSCPVGENLTFKSKVCTKEIDSYLIYQVQKKLNELGYFVPEDNNFSRFTRNAIVRLQKDENLFIGGDSRETLKFLNIEGY